MRGMLGSYRWRRRVAWIGGFVLLTIDLTLQPRPGAKRGPIAFAVELKKATAKGPWLVDSMIPEQGFAPTQLAAKGKKTATTAAPALTGKLSPRWFILPGVLLALI